MADKLDWRGMGDSTPGAAAETNPRNQPARADAGKAADWHGLADSTPASSPPADGKPNR